jgi:hypothetical protein
MVSTGGGPEFSVATGAAPGASDAFGVLGAGPFGMLRAGAAVAGESAWADGVFFSITNSDTKHVPRLTLETRNGITTRFRDLKP